MKEYKINDQVFIVPDPLKNIGNRGFCAVVFKLRKCSGLSCDDCIFGKINEDAFNIWIQDEECVNNFLRGKE